MLYSQSRIEHPVHGIESQTFFHQSSAGICAHTVGHLQRVVMAVFIPDGLHPGYSVPASGIFQQFGKRPVDLGHIPFEAIHYIGAEGIKISGVSGLSEDPAAIDIAGDAVGDEIIVPHLITLNIVLDDDLTAIIEGFCFLYTRNQFLPAAADT